MRGRARAGFDERGARSARAASGEDDGNGLENELEVLRQAPVVDVLHVEVHPLLEGDLVTTTHLPEAGQARANREAAALPRFVLRDLGRDTPRRGGAGAPRP